MSDEIEEHYKNIIKYIVGGRLVPFLGAGANLCNRPKDKEWQPGQFDYLPNGKELSKHLADGNDSLSDHIHNLLRVSQYIAVIEGSGELYEELHELFDANYPPTFLHDFLASIPSVLRNKGYSPRYQLIVTTNYDDVLERAFNAAGEPFDLVYYVAYNEKNIDERGKFRHQPPDGELVLIEKPDEYHQLSLDKRTVILKIHGGVDRTNPELDSFVITEDHYIDYLTHTDISNLIPAPLPAKLRRSHFLFLGYSLSDWNLRVILHRIWGEQKLAYKSWAIQVNPDPVDQKFWSKREVDILSICLEDYIAELKERLQDLPNSESET